MHLTCTLFKKYAVRNVLTCLCLLLSLTITSHALVPGRASVAGERTRNTPEQLAEIIPISYWGPLPVKIIPPASPVFNDPIRFTIQSSKQTVKQGEPFELTITAELLNISPNLLFFQPGFNTYSLRMLLPAGFEQTGGDFTDFVTGELTYPSRSSVTYHIRGFFRTTTPGTSFRLLRGRGQDTNQGLFVEKAVVLLKTPADEPAGSSQSVAAPTNPNTITLLILSDNVASAGSARAAAASYKGYLDYAACDAVSGWVLDANNPLQSQEVDIYVNGVKAATVLGDQRRQDVADAFGIKGYSAYGYAWVIPDYYKSNTALKISVRPAGTSAELTQSPVQTSVCPGTIVSPPTTTTTTPPTTATTTPPTTTTVTPPVTSTTTPPITVTVTPPVTTTTGGALTMLPPTYNCATGAITFNTSGGNGTTIRFKAAGITDWTSNPNQYLDQGSRVNADTPPFTIYMEQSGKTSTYVWSRQATCSTSTPPTNTTTVTTPPVTSTTTPPVTVAPLTMLPPTYNCATGAITFNTSGGDGTTVRFKAAGITDWTSNPNQYLDQGSRVNADTPPFTIYVEQSGKTFTYTWSRQVACSTTTPPTSTTTTPPPSTTVTPPVTSTTTPPVTTTTTPPVTTTAALTMLPPTYNCATGAITFNTSGGNGTTIRFKAAGITDWTSNPNQYLDQGSRVNADTPPFTIYVEQSGKTFTYTWSRQVACSTTTPPTSTTTTPPPSTTVTPPVTTTTTPPVTAVPLVMLPPTYNCATGAITFNTSGGDGTTVRFKAAGITDWTTNPNQYLDQGSRVNADTPPFTIYVEQSGKTFTYTWSRQVACSTTTPPTSTTTTPPPSTTVTPPVTTTTTPPVTAVPLVMLPPTYNCATGAITFNTSGGDGTTVRFKAAGITDWTTNPNQYLDQGSRVNADTPPFVIYVDQSGKTASYTWSRQEACSTTAPPTSTTTTPPPSNTTTTPAPPTNSTSGFYGYRGDDFTYEALPAADPNADPMPAFETDKIKVTLALKDQNSGSLTPGLGGAVYQIYNKARPDRTLVFNALVWKGEDQGVPRTGPPNQIFTGQGLSECLYQMPRPYYGLSETNEPPENPSLGYNPNEVGDDHSNSGRLLKYGKVGNSRFYTEMTPMTYGQVRSPANEVLMKKWGEVKDRALILNYETTFNRSANERVVTKGQESPCLYVNNLRIFKYYNGNNPYSNDGITTFVAPVATNGNGNSATSSNGQRPGGLYVTEPWVGLFGEDGYGIALMLKDNIRSFIGYWGDGGGNFAQPNKGGSYGYMAHAMNELLDMNIKWRHRTEVIVGTVEEIRAYVYANSYRPAPKPSFKFNTAGREGWSLNSGDGDDRHTWDEPYTGRARNGWKVYFSAGSNAQINSPGATWNASQFNKIYIRMAYTGSETRWSLRFRRNRQKGDGNLDFSGKYGNEEAARYPDGTSDRAEQTKYFPVVGDGQFRVYEIDLSQNPEWRNIINEIYLKPHADPNKTSYREGEYAIIDWIDTNPNGPSN
ncbi:hypothetical protein [Spirosoma rigui]|uniref:hypothetical protein n=1 Tax=Spirosoma rigui TaxID=564064 RepID=UPI0012D35EDD|nr:hypothetical protein [Spirosoma rigui]